MSTKFAVGIIETHGLAPNIEAADAMVKAARVTVVGREFAGGGLVTLVVKGEIAAVKSATDAGAAAAARLGEVTAVHVIPRPDVQTAALLVRPGHLAPESADDATAESA